MRQAQEASSYKEKCIVQSTKISAEENQPKIQNVVTAVVVIQEISPFGKMQARKLFHKLSDRRVLERQHRRTMREITGSPHPLSSPPVTLLAILSSLTPSHGPIVLQDRRLLRHLGSCREKPANIHQLLH